MEAAIAGPFPNPSRTCTTQWLFRRRSAIRAPTARFCTCCFRSRPASSISPGRSSASLCRSASFFIIGIPFALLFIGVGACAQPCRGTHCRGPARRAHAAPAARAVAPDEYDLGPHQGRAHRHAHLVVDLLSAADAAARRHLFRAGSGRHRPLARADRRLAAQPRTGHSHISSATCLAGPPLPHRARSPSVRGRSVCCCSSSCCIWRRGSAGFTAASPSSARPAVGKIPYRTREARGNQLRALILIHSRGVPQRCNRNDAHR